MEERLVQFAMEMAFGDHAAAVDHFEKMGCKVVARHHGQQGDGAQYTLIGLTGVTCGLVAGQDPGTQAAMMGLLFFGEFWTSVVPRLMDKTNKAWKAHKAKEQVATPAEPPPVRCVTIVCTREGWCNVADAAHDAAFCAAIGLQEPMNPPVRFPLLALPERLKQLADAGLNAEVVPPPGGEEQVRRACEAPGLAGRVVLMPAPPAEPREPPLFPCEPGKDSFGTPAAGELFPGEPGRPTAQTEGR